MTMQDLDTAVQELRIEKSHRAFTHKLAIVVTAIGAIPNNPPQGFREATLVRLRELADETVAAIEGRIDTAGDGAEAQQKLAGTVYEVRKRIEDVELWFRHDTTRH
jgi:hypothetical protein